LEAYLAKQSILEQLRALDEQKAQLMQAAKEEAMERVREAIDELNSLGYSYRLTEGGRGSGTSRKETRQAKDAPCPICNFKTIPLHDGRAHRSQDPKKPFNTKELADRGFAKV
jgi:hypothetical protein